jgi:hypothetical protein
MKLQYLVLMYSLDHSAVSHQQYPTDNPYDPYQNQTPSNPQANNNYYNHSTPAPQADNYYTRSPPTPHADNYYTQSPPTHADNYYTQSPPLPHADNYYAQSTPAPQADNYYTQAPPAHQADNYFTSTPPAPQQTNYYTPSPPIPQPQDRSYTLGGDGYGNNVLPDPQGQPAYGQYASPINTNVAPVPAPAPGPTSPVRGPRSPRLMSSPYEDNPPVYDSGPSHTAPGGWGSKN